MSARRFIILIVQLGLVAVGLLWPLANATPSSSFDFPDDPVRIRSCVANYRLDSMGTLVASEQVVAAFPSGRHGIFRYFPTSDLTNPAVRYQTEIASITRDGKPEPFRTFIQHSRGEHFLVAKIGDRDRMLSPGNHRFVIEYRVEGAIAPATVGAHKEFSSSVATETGGAESVFFWNVIANGWQMPIAEATVHIELPSDALQVQASCGTVSGNEVTGPCGVEGAGTREVTLTGSTLPPYSGMTARISMALPPPPQTTLPWSPKWDRILGSSPRTPILLGAISVLGLVIGAWMARRAREDSPGTPLLYEPPADMGPVQLAYIVQERVPKTGLVATLFHLADRGLIRLAAKDARSWSATGIGSEEQWKSVDPISRAVATALGIRRAGQRFDVDRSKDAGEKLQAAISAQASAAKVWSRSAGLVVTQPSEIVGRVLVVLALILSFFGFLGAAGPTMGGLIFAGFAIGGTGLLRSGVGQRRTERGRELWSRAAGFRRMLATPSAEGRFDFAAEKDRFIAYVPYAVAFGVAELWARKYRVATGTDAPIPTWYPALMAQSGSPYSRSGGVGSFSAAMTASIGAYQASQSSSSGGGGGGGMGGGGGGGGGGSW